MILQSLLFIWIVTNWQQDKVYGHDLSSSDPGQDIESVLQPEEEMSNLENCSLVSNLSVDAIFIDDNITPYIRLNVSWINIDDDDNNKDTTQDESSVLIRISALEADHRCSFYNLIANYPLLAGSVLTPEAYPMTEFKPDCEYEIVLIQNESDLTCQVNYTVPECVKTICNCSKYAPRPKILSVQPTEGVDPDMDYFVIKWDPGIKTINGADYHITLVTFSFSSRATNYGEADSIKTNYTLHESIVSKKVFKNYNYTITGRFKNNFNCDETIDFYFTAHATSGSQIIIFIVVTAVVLLVALKRTTITKYAKKLLGIAIPRYNHIFNPRESQQVELSLIKNTSVPMNVNAGYLPVEFIEGLVDKYEFPRNKLVLTKEIGSGAFGKVFLAKAVGIGGIDGYKMVAVKTMGERENITKESASDFVAEIEIFKKIESHPNIVKLLGCCTLEPPYHMIMEFVPCGDLKQYLLDLRKQWAVKQNQQIFFPPDLSDGAYFDPAEMPNTPSSITSSRLPSTSDTIYTNLDDPMTPILSQYKQALDRILDHKELQNFAFQIAKGMAHLERIPLTHRDLAARNILISECKVLKISDFGMARRGPYINHKTKKLPLRWTALEALLTQIYDSRSDVWSFGVVLWEIGTLGAFPYEKIPDSFIQQSLHLGTRLERPEICTDELYDLMNKCWQPNPSDRPTFAELVQVLDVNRRKVYVDFTQLNPTYVFPPSEISLFERNSAQN